MFNMFLHRLPRAAALAVLLLLLSGGWQPSRGQPRRGERELQKQFKAVVRHQSNPLVNTNSHVSGSAGKPKADVEKLIALGNKARDDDEYQKALDYYGRALTLNPKEARAHYGLGNVYADQRCSDKALDAYNKAIDSDPKYAAPYRGLASVYSDEKLYEQEVRHLKQALDIKPDDFPTQVRLGWAYIDQENYAEAVVQFKSFLNSPAPERKALGHAMWGFTLALQLDYQAAIEHCQQALSLAPARQNPFRSLKRTGYELKPEELGTISSVVSYLTLYISYNLGNLDNSNQQFAKELGNFFDPHEVSQTTQPDRLKGRVDATKAAEALKFVTLILPSVPDFHTQLGSFYASQHRFKEATQEIEAAIRLRESTRAKSRPEALQCAAGKQEDQKLGAEDFIALGDVFLAQAESEKEQKNDDKAEAFFEKAVEQFEKALSLDGESSSAYLELGIAYRSQDEYEKAIDQFKKALLYLRPDEILGNTQEAILNFHLAHAYMFNEDFDGAIGPLQKFLQLNLQKSSFFSAATPLARFMLGYCFYKTKQYPPAIAQINEVIKTAPNIAEARYLLGLIHYAQKRYGDAIVRLEEAQRMDTNNKDDDEYDDEVDYALGESYRQTGQYQEAIREFEKILSHFPAHSKARYNLGLIYVQLKNKDAALKQYQELKGYRVQLFLEGSNKTMAQDLLDKINAMP